ncbi:ABC transporter permease [Bacillus horti]|uniref:ABC transport system permease protein n=1 Tax=Caldalkalibacillus horti TaxID=77523 RepID=A0ABT9VWG4_9BACI|nr:ABC transporter permease [Bacillus horti]MDQ0165314.1 putative ABC transport system permease protein [Bacillus horti]
MTLFDLALKNVRRNLKNYGLYIGSTIFSIIIYFTFVTLRYSEDINALAESSQRISSIMNASAFVLMIFVAIFIAYSNSFFMKKRKKEIALYSLMGVRKRSIGWMLFFENMVIGLLSLLVGVALGFLLSQLFLSILLKLMGLEIAMGFAFSLSAVIHTMIVFLIIFFITSLQGYRVIYRFKLVELFHAEKKGEELPRARYFSSIIGVFTLVGAYWLALQDITSSEAWRVLGIATPLVIIGLTVLGSYLLFRSVLVYFLQVLKKRKSFAWKGLNVMTLSQLLYRIRVNARTLTIIATLSATTITAGGAVFGLYYNAEKYVQTNTPFTFMWEGEEQTIDSDVVTFDETIYSKSVRVTYGDREMEYTLLNSTTFVKLAEQLGWENIQEPAEGQVFSIDPFFDERWSTRIDSIQLQNDHYSVAALYTEPVFNVSTMGGNAFILTDQHYDEIATEEQEFQAVQVQDYRNQLELSQELSSKTENFSSAVENYRNTIETSGSTLFVGSFLGLVFLVATGSIIYFKTITEAEEDKAKYAVLHKIGVSKKEMKRSIRHQVGMIFIAPLALGLLHGGVALLAFSELLQVNLWVPILLWMFAYTFIYIIYYFATARSFKQTVLKRL